MQLRERRETMMYGRYTIEVYTFYFGDDGGLDKITRKVHFDSDGDSTAENTILCEHSIDRSDVPNGVLTNVDAKLQSAKNDL